MASIQEQIRQLEAAIAAQEALRPMLGDAAVELAIGALRAQLGSLRALQDSPSQAQAGLTPEQLLARMQSYLPRQLAEKMRATGRIEGERKQVTVLFADISGFTALSERLDPEEVTRLTNEALKEMAEAVYQYEGYIDKFIGDAVMAVFGAPVAHEDDPERALRAALAMRERLQRFNRHFADQLQEPLELHMGINTGQVIAGNVGSDLRLSYTVMGDTMNTASRLEGAAGAGQILVSRDTYRLAHEAFTFLALEPITVKGKREPLPVYELQRAKLVPGKSRGLANLPSVFVGREQELTRLRQVRDALAAGEGRVVTLVGDAGLGKSRLLAEWRTQLAGDARWLEGRAFAHTTSFSFGPFLDLFRRHAGIQDDDSEGQARARLRAMVELRFPGDEQAHALFANLLAMKLSPEEEAVLARLQGEALRNALFGLVEQLLATLAGERPTWLVIEDLHWADVTTLELLEHLLPLTRKLPLALVTVSRQHASGVPGRFLAAVRDAYAALHVDLPLTPLSESTSLGMVAQLLSTPSLPAKLRSLILGKAEGNPFFVEEVIRSLIERGALVQDDSGGWVPTALMESITVPDTLQGVLMARLDRLPEETKWVVQMASVIGRIFLYRVLRRMAEGAPGLDNDLDHLEREELVRERARQPEVEYIFKHALTQEAAYQSLLGPRRKELHRRVGEVMEEIFAERLAEFHSILAEHFLRGEAWGKALDYFLKAGDAAARLNAYSEARLHYAKALEALGKLPDAEEKRRWRVETLLRQVTVSFADDPSENIIRLKEAEALASAAPEDAAAGEDRGWRLRAKVQFWLGRAYFYRNDMREALDCFQRMLTAALEHHEEALLTTASMMMGRVMLFQGHFHRAEKLAAQAIGPLQKAGNWQEWIWSLGYHGASLSARGRYAEGREQGDLGLACAQSMNNLTHVGAIQICRAITHLHGGNMELMREAGHGVWTAAEQSNDRLYIYLGCGFEGWAEARLGNLESAFRFFARAKAVRESLGGRLAAMDWFAAALAEATLRAGRVEEALGLAERAVEVARSSGGLFAEGLAQRVWGEALAAAGRWDEAKEKLAASLRLLEVADAPAEAARTRVAWAELAHARGDGAEARRLLDEAAALFENADLLGDLERVQKLRAPAA